jgi:hypothetical protein
LYFALSILAWLLRRYSEPEDERRTNLKSAARAVPFSITITGANAMKYLLLIYNSEQEYDAMPEAERKADFNAHYAYMNELGASGLARGGAPLMPTAAATTVRVRDGKSITTHGPFAETKEQLSGYYMVECDNLDQAIVWAGKIPTARYGSIEIRPIMEILGV